MQAFHPENPLEQALLAASQGGDPDAFLAALREHELLVPAPPPGPDVGETGETVLGPDAEVALPIIEHQGERFVPVYTSETQLARAMPGQEGHLRATGAGLAGMWPPGLGMALNPGGDLGVGLPEETVRALAGPRGGGPVEERLPAGADLMVGAPAQEPEELLAAVRAFGEQHPEVLAAHRALVLVQAPGQQPQLVVGLVLAPDSDPQALLQACAQALDGRASVALVDPERGDPISDWMLEQDAPVFRRG